MTSKPSEALSEERFVVPSGSLIPMVLRRIRSSTPDTKRAIRAAFIWVAIVVVVAIVDALTGSPGQEPFRLVAMVIAAFAFFLRALSTLVSRVSADNVEPGDSSRSHQLWRAMHALPELNAIAAVLFGIATGLFAPSILAFPPFAAPALLFLAFAVGSAREVIRVSRELYHRNVDLIFAAERERVAATDARLTALQAQMNPHFLFNALNTIASLVRTDPRSAERTVENLAGVLRRTLDRSASSLGLVREEVDFVKAYLNIEMERWGKALHVDWDVNHDVLDLQIPVMTLQPLVENALIHGIGQRMEGGGVAITIRRQGQNLDVAISDDGPGARDAFTEGTGLGNLRLRLRELYGDRASLSLRRADGWTTARIQLPVTANSKAQ